MDNGHNRNESTLLDKILNYDSDVEKMQKFGTQADHAINSVINLLEYIESEFNEEQSDDLTRRLYLSIKNRNYKKFEKGLDNIMKSKDNGRSDE